MLLNCYRLWLCFLLLLLSQPIFSVEIMDVEDVKPGMKGEAYTVFYGFKQEKFDVEILGIIKNIEPNKTSILARFSGENIEKTGIAQGMSGSPVYIDGKLIGAIAFTWGFLKEPIGGIQPITQMLPVLEESKQNVLLKGRGDFKIFDNFYGNPIPVSSYSNYQNNNELKTIGVPLVLSGFNKQAFDTTAGLLSSQGIKVVDSLSGGDAGAFEDSSDNLKAGDAVGILLMNGDSQASAVGTVTYVDNDDPSKVLIFGHPFQGLGYVNFPMTKAAVQYTMPIMQLPFKMATPTKIIGTIYNDRSTAVAGKIGEVPHMVPVDVRLIDQRQDKNYNFHYNIVPDTNFFPKLLSGAVLNSLTRYQEGKPQTIGLDYKIFITNTKTKKQDIITIKDNYIGSLDNVTKFIASYIDVPVSQLLYNFYNEVQIDKIDVELNYLQNFQVAKLLYMIIPKNIVYPGEKTTIKVVLETFQNKKETIEIPFTVPYNIEGNVLPIMVSAANIEKQNYEKTYAGIVEPKNYNQLIKSLHIDDLSNQIAIFYDTKGISANIDGYTLKNLPLSKAMDYGIKMQGDKYFGSIRDKQTYKTNYIITGELQSYILIKNKKG